MAAFISWLPSSSSTGHIVVRLIGLGLLNITPLAALGKEEEEENDWGLRDGIAGEVWLPLVVGSEHGLQALALVGEEHHVDCGRLHVLLFHDQAG